MSELRKYERDTPQQRLYREMYANQTLGYVLTQKKCFASLHNAKMTMKQALERLDSYVDPSDPDFDEGNAFHAYQTSESIRKQYPNDKELQLVGLIHDIGKVLYAFGVPNWSVVGDTYVVGCKIPKSVVYSEETTHNPEYHKYDEFGIYAEGCGIDKLHLTYGHDEYMFQVLYQNSGSHKLSPRYWNIIRYHSFYPWHTQNEYQMFMNPDDYKTLEDVKMFNHFDLYSKADEEFRVTRAIKDYYEGLLNEYFPEPLNW